MKMMMSVVVITMMKIIVVVVMDVKYDNGDNTVTTQK